MDLNIYFNEWAFLARTAPDVFERRRESCIEQFLSESGARREQLEALQRRIDAERQRAGTPVEAVRAISAMMCASLGELAGEMQNLSADLCRLEPQHQHPIPPRDVTPACMTYRATRYRALPYAVREGTYRATKKATENAVSASEGKNTS